MEGISYANTWEKIGLRRKSSSSSWKWISCPSCFPSASSMLHCSCTCFLYFTECHGMNHVLPLFTETIVCILMSLLVKHRLQTVSATTSERGPLQDWDRGPPWARSKTPGDKDLSNGAKRKIYIAIIFLLPPRGKIQKSFWFQKRIFFFQLREAPCVWVTCYYNTTLFHRRGFRREILIWQQTAILWNRGTLFFQFRRCF